MIHGFYKRHRIALRVSAIVLVVGVTVSTATASAFHSSRLKLAPQNVTALNSQSTLVSGAPASVHAPSPSLAPIAGSIHRLGGGRAFAWVMGGNICWSSGSTYGVAGCTDPSNNAGFGVAVHQVQLADGGIALHVSGVAVDSVRDVTVYLADGTGIPATLADNWYDVALPSSIIAPDQIAKVVATISGGNTTTLTLS